MNARRLGKEMNAPVDDLSNEDQPLGHNEAAD